uniref:VWFA domain-containing protein n=1 Tax=Rhabditophanes sp. KR3021 TaxID=114890 RepID=A0AC35UBQ1_9BILA
MYIVATIAIIITLVRYLFEWLEIDNAHKRTVLITGYDSACGHKTAFISASESIAVFAGCLTLEGIANLEKESKKLSGEIYPCQINVGSSESIKRDNNLLRKN